MYGSKPMYGGGGSSGRAVLGNIGRQQQQGPVNYRGSSTKPAYDYDSSQFQAGGRNAPAPSPAAPGASPLQQTKDMPFNRYKAPPKAPMSNTMPVASGYSPTVTQPGAQPGVRAANPGVYGGAPAYNGMMGQKTPGLMRQLGGPAAGAQVIGGQAPAGVQGQQGQAVPNPVGAQSQITYRNPFERNTGGSSNEHTIDAPGPDVNLNEDQPPWGERESSAWRDAHNNAPPSTGPFTGTNDPGGVPAPNGQSGTDPFSQMLQSIMNAMGGGLNNVTNAMTDNDMARLHKYFGDSESAYKDIMDRSKDLMDPATRKAAEDAARGDLQAGVDRERDAAYRHQNAGAGRGAMVGSGGSIGIANAATQAMQAGERGLAQDAFKRLLAATQVGIQGEGAGAKSLEDLLNEAFTSNKEGAAMLLGGADKAMDMFGNANQAGYQMSPFGMAAGTGLFNPGTYMGMG